MFKKIKEFFVGKPAEVAPVPTPYKVEIAPVEASAASMKEELKNPLVVALEQTSSSTVEVVPAGTEATMAAPAKKPRKPRAPKAETTAKEKAPAKTRAPKLTVVKAEKTPRSKKA